MILVIDTSAALALMAAIRPGDRSEVVFNARDTPLAMQYPNVVGKHEVEKVAVVTGPGSFTGLRVGVSFGLGLAIGLGVPIVPLPSLDLLAARSREPVIAVKEAGRGRFYYLVPGQKPALGEASDIPKSHPIVDSFEPATGLRSFAEAAEILLRTAREVPYRSLEIEYMQSLSVRR